MEGSREFMITTCSHEKTVSFVRIFDYCENRIHAIFLFLSLLELVQLRFLNLVTGEGKNNFIIEWNENRETDQAGLLPDEKLVSLN